MTTNQEPDFGLQMAPLLNLFFVLLLYFAVSVWPSMVKASHEALITVKVQAPPVLGQQMIPAEIEIDEDNTVSLFEVPISSPGDRNLDRLVTRMKAIIARNPQQPVLVSPAPGVKQQRVIDVLNACDAANVQDLTLGKPPATLLLPSLGK
jgi:biopolymer transport protein ExbD